MNLHLTNRFTHFVAAGIAAMALGTVACGGSDTAPSPESIGSTEQAATGTLSISGTVTDATGAGLAGVAVRLSGTSGAATTTAAGGTYTFAALVAGSYSVSASLAGCQFDPSVVNLNGFTANATANFSGSGSTCGGAAKNSGAVNGTFTISGSVTDRLGGGLSGVVVRLNGAAQAFRTTTEAGTYSFSVNRGSYSLSASFAGCTFTPPVVNENGLAASVVVNFTGNGGSCAVSGGSDAGATPPATDAAPPPPADAGASNG